MKKKSDRKQSKSRSFIKKINDTIYTHINMKTKVFL